MDYQFTATMEDQLDTVAEGKLEWRPMLHEFYNPFESQLEIARDEMPDVRQEAIGRDRPVSGHPLVIRYGRFGKFIGCANYPECRYTEPWLDRTSICLPHLWQNAPRRNHTRKSQKGRTFYGCSRYPECDFTSWKRPLRSPVRTAATCSSRRTKPRHSVLCKHTYPMDELAEMTPVKVNRLNYLFFLITGNSVQ